MNRSHPADLPKSKTPEERQQRIEMASKQKSVYNNPCVKEQELSLKCLANNNYDKSLCANEFVNYTSCQKFWTKVRNDRKKRGITPELPRPEDRESIKAEYFKERNL